MDEDTKTLLVIVAIVVVTSLLHVILIESGTYKRIRSQFAHWFRKGTFLRRFALFLVFITSVFFYTVEPGYTFYTHFIMVYCWGAFIHQED